MDDERKSAPSGRRRSAGARGSERPRPRGGARPAHPGRRARTGRRPRRALAGVVLAGTLLAAAGALLVFDARGARDGAPALGPVDGPVATAAAPDPSPEADGADLSPGPDRLLLYQRHTLSLRTDPAAATARLLDASSAVVWEGPTPASAELPGGRLRLELSLPGSRPESRDLVLDRDLELDLLMDPEGLLHRSLVRFTTGSNPKQVAFSPDGAELWVSLLGGAGLEVFDPWTGRRLAEVDLGDHGAVEVIFTADGSKAYASQMETASVYEIDRAGRRVLRRLATGGEWTKVMALSPDERTLYAANWVSDDVSEIDLATGAVRRRLPTVRTPRGLYVTPDGGRLFVAGYDDGEIQRVDLRTGDSAVLLRTGGAMRHFVGDGRYLYADDMALDKVFVVDLESETVRELAATDEKPNTIDLSPDGRVLYVSNRGENGESYYQPGPEWGSVLALDTTTGAPLDAIVGGNQCTGLDVSPDGRLLAFSDFLDNRVRLYAIPDYEVLAGGGGGRAGLHLAEVRK